MSRLQSAAAKYTSLGLAIIPVYWVRDDGVCACGDRECKKPGKHPINTRGASDPITDPEVATRQWEQTPKANIGIVAGASNYVIVDADSDEAIDRLQEIADDETWEAIVNAPKVKTAKGYHFYLADTTGGFGPSVGKGDDLGIDIRAGVSYVVAPPSLHASGTTYAWETDKPPFDAPRATPWLQKYVTERREQKEKSIVEEGFTVSEGSRADFIVEMAGVLRRRGFNEEEINASLIPLNRRVVNPPLSEKEVRNHVHGICQYPPSGIPESFKVASTSTDDLIERLHALDTRHLVEDAPPLIDWVWQDYLAPGTLNMLHGDGGLGKSYLSLKIAEQMLQPDGGELFARKIKAGGVVILDGENAESQIHHRVHATMIRADSPLTIFTLAEPILGYEEKTQGIFDWIAETHDPRLVIVDSQRALWAGDEKEQMEVGRMLRRLAKGIEDLPFAMLLLHHDNRGKDYAGSSDTNAAISGARFHMEKHGTKNETQARRLSMPKNRIGPEMIPEEFTMSIETMPRSHRHTISGIQIKPYETGAEQAARELLEQAKMKILNAPCTNSEIWSAYGWEMQNYQPREKEQRDVWKVIQEGLEAAGFVHERQPGSGSALVWKYPR
jgi:hypothetical protein